MSKPTTPTSPQTEGERYLNWLQSSDTTQLLQDLETGRLKPQMPSGQYDGFVAAFRDGVYATLRAIADHIRYQHGESRPSPSRPASAPNETFVTSDQEKNDA